MTPDYYRSLPTIRSLHFDNVVSERPRHLVLVSRMTVADGAPEDKQVFVEIDSAPGWESRGNAWVNPSGVPQCRGCDGTGSVARLRAYCGEMGFHSQACDVCDGLGVTP